MGYHTTKFPIVPLIAFIMTSFLAVARPDRVAACDAGVAKNTRSIAEIDLVSTVVGSKVVRSLPSQEAEGAPATIRIIEVKPTANVVLGSGLATADGQYTIELLNPLVLGQRIQAFNATKGYYSATVTVSASHPPAINEPVAPGAVRVTGVGTPGSTIQIRNAITGLVLGTDVVPPKPSDGIFTVSLSAALPYFHTIRAHDITKGLVGKNVPILNLNPNPDPNNPLEEHVPLRSSCGISRVLFGNFTKTTFTCGLPRPREIAHDSAGKLLILVGTAPSDRAITPMPSGTFRLAPTTGALSLFAPVSGVALKPGRTGSAFGTDLFVARARVLNARRKVTLQPGDGEIFRVHPTSAVIRVFTRTLDFAPTGMAFPPTGSPFSDNMFVTDFFGAGVRRISSTGNISFLTPTPANLPGLHGLAFAPAGTSLFATQPNGGRIFQISSTGAFTSFATGMKSPIALAFGPGGISFGTDLYVSDAGNGTIWRINSTGGRTAFATGLGAPYGLVFSQTTPPSLSVTDYQSGNIFQFTPNSR